MFGLNPYEFFDKVLSQIASNMTAIAFWTIFSLGLAILRGLSSFFPGLGIITLLAGENLNLPLRTSLEVLSNHFLFIPSRVLLSVALDMLPGLLFISL